MKLLVPTILTAFTILYVDASPSKKPDSASIRHHAASLAPGTYQDWDKYFDEVVVIRTPDRSMISRVDVAPITYLGVRLPSEKDNTYKAVQEVLAAATQPFVRGVKEKMANKSIPVQISTKQNGAGLLIRTRITRMDPGSQAARYWGSFSAGAAIVEITGELVDVRSNAVLITFRQERRSGWGLLGGGYHALLDRDIRQIGGDVAGLINAI